MNTSFSSAIPPAFSRQPRRRPVALATSIATLVASLLLASSPRGSAGSAIWNATPTNGNWVAGAGENNWSTGTNTFPGSTAGLTSTDGATFNSASTTTTIVINSPSLNFSVINFTSAAANFTIGTTAGNPLLLTDGGGIQILSSLTATNAIETINAPLVIEGATYQLSNFSTSGAGAGAGTLNIGGAISGGAAVASELRLTGGNTNANTISGNITNGTATPLSILKNGIGTWVLTGTNTYSGGTTINSGTLRIGNIAALGSGTITFTGAGTLESTVTGTLTNDITGNAFTSLTIGAASGQTLTLMPSVFQYFGGAGTTLHFGSATDTGTVVLAQGGSGFDTTGAIAVDGGVLKLGTISALGFAGTLASLTLAAGTEVNSQLTGTLDSAVTFATAGSSTVSAAAGKTLSLTKLVMGGGNAVFGSAGNTGTVSIGTLTPGNSVSGSSTIEVAFGTLQNSGGLNFFTNIVASTTVDAGATLDVNDNSMTVRNLLGAGWVTLGSNAATELTVNKGAFSGVISGSGQVTKDTAGTLVLTGTNTYTGGTNIAGGLLTIGNIAALGSGTVTFTGDATLESTVTGTLTNKITSGAGISPTIGAASGKTLTLSGDFTYTGGAGTTLHFGSATDTGTVALAMNGVTVGLAGQVAVDGGVLRIETSNGLNLVDDLPITLATGTELNSQVTGPLNGGVTFATTGNSTVSAAAGTTLSMTNLKMGAGNAVFGSAGNTGTVSVGTLTMGSSVVGSSTIEVAFGTLQNGGGPANLDFFTRNAASTTVDAGATLDVNDKSMEVKNLQGAGAVTLGASAATVLTVDGGTFSGVISGAGQLTKDTAGTLVLTGNNTYTGLTNVADGILQLGNGGTSGGIAGNLLFTGFGGTLVFNRSDAVTFAGSIGGSGVVKQNGPGALTLTAASTYTGTTIINAGRLITQNASAVGGSVVVLNAGALQVKGALNITHPLGLEWVGGKVALQPGAGDVINTTILDNSSGGTKTFDIDTTGIQPITYNLDDLY